VLTAQARQGIFRFFRGVDNQNATAITPTVDRNGNPVRPAGAPGDLQSFNVFKLADGSPRDPNRTGYDSWVQSVLLAVARASHAGTSEIGCRRSLSAMPGKLTNLI
jgi:hypothetical protein